MNRIIRNISQQGRTSERNYLPFATWNKSWFCMKFRNANIFRITKVWNICMSSGVRYRKLNNKSFSVAANKCVYPEFLIYNHIGKRLERRPLMHGWSVFLQDFCEKIVLKNCVVEISMLAINWLDCIRVLALDVGNFV